jgi:hypothetical protein
MIVAIAFSDREVLDQLPLKLKGTQTGSCKHPKPGDGEICEGVPLVCKAPKSGIYGYSGFMI